METEEFNEFLRKILSYYSVYSEKIKLSGDLIHPSVAALREAISFVNQKELYLIPEEFNFNKDGSLSLSWKNSNKEFLITFHNNKDVEYSKSSPSGELKEKFFQYVEDMIYFQDLKEIELEMLNYLEGGSEMQAFKSLLG